MAKISASKVLLKARSLERKGDLKGARILYESVLATFPQNRQAEKAISVLWRNQYHELLMLYERGYYEKVIHQGRLVVQEFPSVYEVWELIGVASLQVNDQDSAATAFKKAVELSSDNAGAHSNLGIALARRGQFAEAIESYQKAIAINSNCAETHGNLGMALRVEGQLALAIESYKRAIGIDPNSADNHVNLGIALATEGQFVEAIESYQSAIAIDPDSADTHNNLGLALAAQGHFGEAIESYQRAISIDQNHSKAHNNFGIALAQQGRLTEAIEFYQRALAIDPNYAKALTNLGVALADQGDFAEAIKTYQRAISIQPDFADTHSNLGNALKAQGQLLDAIESYQRAFTIDPTDRNCLRNFGILLKTVRFHDPIPHLYPMLGNLISLGNLVRPFEVAPAILSLLKHDPILQPLLDGSTLPDDVSDVLNVIDNLASLPLLHQLMRLCPLADLDIEALLCAIRSRILENLDRLNETSRLHEFQSSLPLQCFTNEYVFYESDRELLLIEDLENRVREEIESGKQSDLKMVLCLSAYRPMHNYQWAAMFDWPNVSGDVKRRLIDEPLQERELLEDIPRLSEISDQISLKVREQYEKHPYPRWVTLPMALKPLSVSEVANERQLKLSSDAIRNVQSPKILIAGCGTGQHSIEAATRYKNCAVTAVDLSRTSLAYAKRNTIGLGLENIDYKQADILDLAKLDDEFDVIESSGVLHHMENPLEGWRVLTSILKPGGLMKIGLYSELARVHIIKVRSEIEAAQIGVSNKEIREFRNSLVSSGRNHHRVIMKSSDAYSLSALRDLIFHTQEHRFSIPEIKECIASLGLEFCGFEGEAQVSDFMRVYENSRYLYDLDCWHEFETDNPNVFAGMYQFWCQKLLQ